MSTHSKPIPESPSSSKVFPEICRRRFMTGTLGVGAGMILAPLFAGAQNALAADAPVAGAAKKVSDFVTKQPWVTLNDGRKMPQLGLGVWRLSSEEAKVSMIEALAYGYRSVDTAAIYRNEEAVGEAFRASGQKREDVFITTKVWNDEQGFDASQKALDKSLKRLGLDYVDLLLIHWPVPQQNLYSETWRAFIQMREKKLARSIGVSNFNEEQLKQIISETKVTPVLNQVQLHPYMQQRALRAVHDTLGIYTQAWSPLAQGKVINDPVIGKIAEKHRKTAAQVVIRWHLQSRIIVIPRSSKPARVRENFDVFDFTLDAEDMKAIEGLDGKA
ncbi:MAG: aldo/keto reductase [Candidatus Accumulibacter sp.]|nr:aldo/keto reductase [Accumulibacter sp.]